MKKLVNYWAIILLLTIPGIVPASETEAQQTSSPWTTTDLHNTLASMPEGNSQRGQQLHHSLMCVSCHGEAGVAPSRNYPSLAGQRREYTYKVLLDYKTYRRDEGIPRTRVMNSVLQLLSEQDMADVASYYASLPLPETVIPAEQIKNIEQLVRKGDPSRLVTACASCHGLRGQGGINETPALAGQIKEYFIRTMHAYKDGVRNNDVEQGMAQFASELSDEEIQALAHYYSLLHNK